ncbi:MAG: WecB/TagA/CpsF family glycosyltransferase [Clostridiales bacterium]|nr:WecB/TagA/CpsF family glycosyltransferase [Clostridiales bacterium]
MDTNTVRIMDVPIYKMGFDEAFKKFIQFSKGNRFRMIFTPNTEMVMMAEKDIEFKDILNESDMNIPDGFGLVLASRIRNLGAIEKIAGIDFMTRILEYCDRTGSSIFILGGGKGIAEEAAKRIKATFHNIDIRGTYHGYFNEQEEFKIIDMINEKKPDILFVALGAPKQEKWIYKNKSLLNVNVAIGVGGSIDVWAGRSKRAPKVFINSGFEWLYRLLKQPTRFFRMMVIPQFLFKIYYEKIFNR